MLCSVSTGKSGSNWLDRLRSSRGFPTGIDLDLDHFLTPQDNNLSNSSNTNASDSVATNIDPKLDTVSCQPGRTNPVVDRTRTAETVTENGDKDWFGIMSNALAELFVMGNSSGNSHICTKKSSRKQRNPKICVLSKSSSVDEMSSDGVRRDDGVSATIPSSGDNSLTEAKNKSVEVKVAKLDNADCVDVEEEDSYADLKAFSRSEVTVIDTSCATWKFEKLLFRRKNVWKVREKKYKTKNVGRKKRKAGSTDENVGNVKRPKVTIVPLGSSKKAKQEECIVAPNERQSPQYHEREEAYKSTPDIVSQVPKKRFPFSRSPRKLRKASSSVFLVKGSPTGKKNGVNIPKSHLKDTQRQCRA